MYNKLFIKDKGIHDLIDNISYKRNKYIHPDHGNEIKVLEDDILEWFKMLKTILKKIRT